MPVKDESEATLEGSSMEVSLADLVEAQDRTTHAVRSLALYLFITIATSFLGVALILIAVPVAVFIGAAIILAGFVWSIVAGIDELSKSKP
jgi:NADH:ubiquinone oxidoreductase subunit 6 (subunit J)